MAERDLPEVTDEDRAIRQSGLFQAERYLSLQPELARAGGDPIAHFLQASRRRPGRVSPNFYFDPGFYARQLRGPLGGLDPFVHYVLAGAAEGLRPSPYFDPHWYARTYEVPIAGALRHYLDHCRTRDLNPIPAFDAAFYRATYPDLAGTDIDPFEHYVSWGVFEGRRPSRDFDPAYVWRRYLNDDRRKNPYAIFLVYKDVFGWRGVPDPEEPTVPREVRRNSAPGPLCEEVPARAGSAKRAKAIAFYLPQFHAIPENDRWWGPGFTEWRNLSRGLPRFAGHYQPRVPRDLGFYTLDDPAVMHRQIALARGAGLHGFCFYYYNFNGRRLLEKPLEAFLADPAADFPFCLMWANENWTRRWDGLEKDVLIGQDYRPEDAADLVADLARFMADPRYIRLKGRPLLFIYRANIIPDCVATLARWRSLFRIEHGLEPLLVMAQTFGSTDPRPFGFDAAVEFPPHKFGEVVPRINQSCTILDPDFAGDVRSYDDVVRASLADFPADFPLIKTVLPSWDNDARKQGGGMVLHGSTPAKFQAWVEAIGRHLRATPVLGERLFCVNAWNEWAEGAYLEPDVHYGYAYLNALGRGLAAGQASSRRKLLLVGHDAYPAGAQQLLYNIGLVLRFRFGVEVAFVLMDGGALAERYAQAAPTYVVDPGTDFWPALVAHLARLRGEGFQAAITNSTFSGHIVGALADMGFEVCSLIHELRTVIARNGGTEHLKLILARSGHVVFPDPHVRDEITAAFGAAAGAVTVRPQGLYRDIGPADPAALAALRRRLAIPPGARVVLNAGYADLRKGVDKFLAIGEALAERDPPIVFVWLGDADPAIETWLLQRVRGTGSGNLRWVPYSEDVGLFMHMADLFLLTSREDPFPSVLLEALAAGTPVAAFEGGGGYAGLVGRPGLGFLLPDRVDQAAAAVAAHLQAGEGRGAAATAARRDFIRQHHDFADYCFDLLAKVVPARRVSVIVPNYNYRALLAGRLASIFEQTHPVFELIVLDDGSRDGSVAEIERIAAQTRRDFVLIENAENAGNVFAQWAKGVAAARGELVWIAEADDLSDPGFLDGVAPFLDEPDVALAFADSSAVDGDGLLLWDNHKSYYRTIAPDALQSSGVFDGATFLRDFLSVKNCILNVSAVLWRRTVLAQLLERCAADLSRLHMAGDWRLYIEACRAGRIAYQAQPLNIHRRHGASVTHALDKDRHLREIRQMHNIVRGLAGIEGAVDRQRRYVAEVEQQFGLAHG